MNKTVIVTGGANGIGYHIARAFAKQNYNVVAFDITKAEFKENNIEYFKGDLSNEEHIKALFAHVKNKYGAVHVLINNGAISKFSKSISQITLEEFDKVIAVNLRGSFICAKEFVNANKGENYGRIINISSTRFHQNEENWEAYGASKGGLVALTNSLCVSLINTPITVNAISPGWIQTQNYESLKPKDHEQHPSRRVGKPADIANACLFFCEEENDFINGANLIIDGGMTKKMIYENTEDYWN